MNFNKDKYLSNLCDTLQSEWHRYIPLSKKIGIRINKYTGKKFITTMPKIENQNPHNTIFAGSLFSLATLTGWGLIWILLQEKKLNGTIILADAEIKYIKPMIGQSWAVTYSDYFTGNLNRLINNHKAILLIKVELFGNNSKRAIFNGKYFIYTK